jgi:hypothetical protein
MVLARRPSPLGGRISGEGGDGDLLGERGGHGMDEMFSTAVYRRRRRRRLLLLLLPIQRATPPPPLLEVVVVCVAAEVVVIEVAVEVDGVRMRGRPRMMLLPRLLLAVRRWNLDMETIVETRLRRERATEDEEREVEVEDMVEGECLRLGGSFLFLFLFLSASSVGRGATTRGKAVRMKEGMILIVVG